MTQTGYGLAVTKAPLIQALVIQPDESFELREIDQSPQPFRALIGGGDLEDITTEHATFWCDKEGDLRGLPNNPLATWLWWKIQPEVEGVNKLQGTVVVTGGADEAGDSLAVHPEVVKLLDRIKQSINQGRAEREEPSP